MTVDILDMLDKLDSLEDMLNMLHMSQRGDPARTGRLTVHRAGSGRVFPPVWHV